MNVSMFTKKLYKSTRAGVWRVVGPKNEDEKRRFKPKNNRRINTRNSTKDTEPKTPKNKKKTKKNATQLSTPRQVP